MESNDTTFYIYQDAAAVFHVADELGQIPREHRELAQPVEVTQDEATVLRNVREEEGTDVVSEVQMLTGAPLASIQQIIEPAGIDFVIIGLGLALVATLVVFRNMAKSGGHRLLTHIIASFIFTAIGAVGYNAIKQYQGTKPTVVSEAPQQPANELEKKGQEAIERLQKRRGTQRKVLDAVKREQQNNRR